MLDIIKYHTISKEEIFRLELLDKYTVPDEKKYYAMFLDGKARPHDKQWIEYINNMRIQIKSGIQYFRVHVVTTPLSDYLKFEINWYYKDRKEAGEKLYILDREIYKTLLDIFFVPHDFYIFDNKIGYELIYDSEGHFIKEVKIDSKKLTQYLLLKEKLINKGAELDCFVKEMI